MGGRTNLEIPEETLKVQRVLANAMSRHSSTRASEQRPGWYRGLPFNCGERKNEHRLLKG